MGYSKIATLLVDYVGKLSSPPAESARAVTGRRCPHSGGGGGRLFDGSTKCFSKTAINPERKVEKSFPRWEMNGHAEGYKWAIDQNWGRMAKIGFLDQKTKILGPKKGVHFSGFTMFWPRPEKVVQSKKLPLPK